MKEYIKDDELGVITICYNRRERKYRLKVSDGKLIATLPLGGKMSDLLRLIEKNRERLKEALETTPKRPKLNEETDLQATTFRVRITCQSTSERFLMQLHDGILQISCPQGTDFSDDKIQTLLRDMLSAALRHEAKRLLPVRVKYWADKYGFTYSQVKITNSRTHWGSCSMKKGLCLSLNLMLLPWHLIDYVLLHELCHTVEMNHSQQFWELMDKVTQGKSKQLREEIKQRYPLL